MGLTENQVNEIAKLPSGVAVVYQNNWVSPVLTMVDKANVEEEIYKPEKETVIRTIKSARTQIIRMLMQPWILGNKIPEKSLYDSLRVLELTRSDRQEISSLIADYSLFNGNLVWKQEELPKLRRLLQNILGIKGTDYQSINSSSELVKKVSMKLKNMKPEAVQEICFVLTNMGGNQSGN